MGTIDFTAPKLKLLSSIVAISAIQLLKQFMETTVLIAKNPAEADQLLFWYVVIHLVFVGSRVLLALSDRIAAYEPAPPHPYGNAGNADEDKSSQRSAH